jgi:hypothetical protein
MEGLPKQKFICGTTVTIKQTALIGSDNIAKAQLFALSNPLPGSLDFSN